MLDSLAVQKAYAAAMLPDDPRAAANKERFERHEALVPAAPKARALRRPVDGRPVVPLEKDIQRAVLQFLRVHPKVAAVWRTNSGTFTEQNRDGSMRYISANTMPGMSDVCGVLKGGRAFFFEIKRPGAKATTLQLQFLQRMHDAGALALVVYSIDSLVNL